MLGVVSEVWIMAFTTTHCRHSLICLLAVLTLVLSVSSRFIQTIDLADHGVSLPTRADSSLTGYLGAFFLGSDPYVYFYLSNGNNAVSFKASNKGSPVMRPSKGTGGVRDPAIVRGGGAEAGRKWYIVGTDLNIGKVCFVA